MSIHKQLFCLSGSGYAEFVIVFVAVVVICIVVVKASVVGGGGGDEQGEQSESEKKIEFGRWINLVLSTKYQYFN